MVEKKQLKFEQLDTSKTHPNKKTKVFEIRNEKDTFLGTVEWKNTWRQYIFTPPAYTTIWARGCIKELYEFIERLMQERKVKRNDK